MKLSRLHLCIALHSALLAAAPAWADGFRVAGSAIIGPDGKPFIPLGVNMNGSEWGWNAKTAPLADLVATTWKLNTIRLNCRVPGVRPSKWPSYQVLSFGPRLARDAGGEFENIVFSFHTYDQWRFGEEKMRDYLQRVHAKQLAIFIGETGAPGDNDPRRVATELSYRVALPLGVGILAWHGQPGDGFALCEGKKGGVHGIDAPDTPTNLNWHGKLLREAARSLIVHQP